MTDWATVASLATAGARWCWRWRPSPRSGRRTGRPGSPNAPPGQRSGPCSPNSVRDFYLPPGDTGFWQGALRDPAAEVFTTVRRLIEDNGILTVSVRYGNFDGGQRVISQFALRYEEQRWLVTAGRHFQLDRPDPQ